MATKTAKTGYASILPKLEQKDRVFLLSNDRTPIRYMIPVKHTGRKPLTYFDGNLNRALRWATNQVTPFVDEQDGIVTMEPITFENGKLFVPSWNINLQKFLLIHPGLNKVFYEFDKEKQASESIESIYTELEAQLAAKDMDIEELEGIARVALPKANVSKLTSSELRRDMIIWAKANPGEFMDLINDENIQLRNLAVRAVEMNILSVGSDNRTVSFSDNKKEKLMVTPFGENVYSALALFFKTDQGLDVMQKITNKL